MPGKYSSTEYNLSLLLFKWLVFTEIEHFAALCTLVPHVLNYKCMFIFNITDRLFSLLFLDIWLKISELQASGTMPAWQVQGPELKSPVQRTLSKFLGLVRVTEELL